MGTTHIGSAVAFSLAGGAASALCGASVPAGHLAGFTAVAAVSALLPDIDHASSLISRAVCPLPDRVRNWLWARLVAPLTGGHRWRTHTWEFAALAGLLAGLVMIAAVTALSEQAAEGFLWAGPAVTLGCLAHLAGDWATRQGIPWTLRNCAAKRRVTLGWFRTNGPGEHLVLVPLQTFAAVGFGLLAVGWTP